MQKTSRAQAVPRARVVRRGKPKLPERGGTGNGYDQDCTGDVGIKKMRMAEENFATPVIRKTFLAYVHLVPIGQVQMSEGRDTRDDVKVPDGQVGNKPMEHFKDEQRDISEYRKAQEKGYLFAALVNCPSDAGPTCQPNTLLSSKTLPTPQLTPGPHRSSTL